MASNLQTIDPKAKVALITGFTGQDGTFLAQHLLNLGYVVIGLVRRISTEPPRRQRGHFNFIEARKAGHLILQEGDLLSPSSLNQIITKWQPDEIYNLAAQSHVGVSFKQPEYTIDSILTGTINLITALETCHRGKWRMYQASTSEMFGNIPVDEETEFTINEETPINPNSPYAIAKAAAHQYCKMKRNQGHFISCGILFNHESEIRGEDFVTQKIVKGLHRIKEEYQAPIASIESIKLGNLESRRDWGYAGDYVIAMHIMLQHDIPDDFVIATNRTHSVRDFINEAIMYLGEYGEYGLTWRPPSVPASGKVHAPESINTGYLVYRAKPTEIVVVETAPEFYRPNDVGYLRGDYSKAKRELGWEPAHTFIGLVKTMMRI